MPVKKGSSKTGKTRDSEERIVHEFHIISEGLVSQIKQVAEGVANVDQKLDRTREELKAEIEQKTQLIAQAVVRLDGRVGGLDEKVSRLDERMDALEGKVSILDGKVNTLDAKVSTLDARVSTLDAKVSTLDAKVSTLDEKVDGVNRELKTEIQETRQEILAAVKFSYAELDRRLTTLEKEFLDLKSRVDKIESRGLS